jgi:putative CRISPR-associated protein (TIGR02619 family)
MKIATPATTLISTVGTSLFFPNLSNLRSDNPNPALAELATAYARKDWLAIATQLGTRPYSDQICGAELNSLASLFDKKHVDPGANLFFCHSDTPDGRAIASILLSILQNSPPRPLVKLLPIDDLQDKDPRRFRTRGLRNLARAICQVIREYGAANCAINATGGYKAQIAIAVMMGQAIHVPVYYKHERFNEIIAFPPMPVALDFSVWLAASGMLFDLESASDPVPLSDWFDGWDERYESLVERVLIDGVEYIELSPTGQIVHDTFRQRFRTDRDEILPPPAPAEAKRPPKWEASGHMRAYPEIQRILQQLTEQVPQLIHCATFYFNPDLPTRPGFRIGAKGIEGWLSNGTWTTKFRVETTAKTPGQELAVVAALNEWLIK